MRIALLLLCLTAFAFRTRLDGPDKPAYRLYTPKLKATTYIKLLRQAADADVVLFGELHNNPICHWLELQLTKDLQSEKKGNLVLGAEMFEADNQTALSDYVQGRTTGKELAQQARLWQNYDTDYKPIADFAREQHIPFIATNVPRRYARQVSRQGLASLDTISAEGKRQMAPLPLTVDLTLPGYEGMMKMMSESAHGGSSSSSAANPQGATTDMTANFARAQAIKDATMAHFILQNLKPGQTMLHFNGDYHSKNFEGIVWYLRKQRPDLKIVTLSSVETPDPDKPERENQNLADFVLAIPADMTKTY
ncbi:ChaN family lipoprotein [Spirosoma validum]|uniref:ChaN family lipoprotein n=1 Tax=Spirosoma validum TaxID=2771355 RepID=A0A927GD38_9BACT|nr:ChaN family lipoprotein [Spirosoma validum]MBD2753160.1 ChaN family lipoprotein [Spirosoma validum]